MIKEPSTSILDAKEIEEYIKTKYSPIKFNINIHRREEVDIYIETKTEREGFEVITPMIFKEPDIINIAKDILKQREIDVKKLFVELEHVEGDSMEPMDYGSIKFRGVKFQWPEEKTKVDL